eukprot:TRINITY_DN21682_c0_g1_i1.p1 TRINITY_DN21682_c0_g1~~TRINITY_DN21682_c0_g1_i1.p1  ORF type:complete len:564 (+),score=100.16 TRINITY_DN21682_c0_g1_i1:129-1820(+)
MLDTDAHSRGGYGYGAPLPMPPQPQQQQQQQQQRQQEQQFSASDASSCVATHPKTPGIRLGSGDEDDEEVISETTQNGNVTGTGATREALVMLASMVKTYVGKRSVGDIVSVMADPSIPFRLYPIHQQKYENQLEAFDEVPLGIAVGTNIGWKPTNDQVDDIAAPGWLPRAALASLFARAAYGVFMRRGLGDSVQAFAAGAAKYVVKTGSAKEQIDAFLELSGAQPAEILMSSWEEKTYEPAFVIFWAHRLRWLVLVVRGSSEWQSVLTDVSAEACDLADGRAHSGMVRSARWLLERAGPVLVGALHTMPEYQLVCTGHSLGADIATVVAVMAREGCVDPASPPPLAWPLPMRKAFAYAFGASPIFSPELARKMMPFVLSVSRDADYISRLSIFSMDRFILELTEKSAPKLVKNWFVSKLGLPRSVGGSRTARERVFGDSAAVPEMMLPPGRLLHVHRRGIGQKTGPVRLYWPMPSFFQDMLVSPHMFHDHLPIRYVEDLLQVVRQNAPAEHHPELYLKVRASTDPRAQEKVREALEAVIVDCTVAISKVGGGSVDPPLAKEL